MVYPPKVAAAPAHRDMPEDVRQLYAEAAAVAEVSPRAGAALARATVERLIKHLDSATNPQDNLNKRIDRLAARVSSELSVMLHVVRETGNQALHEDSSGNLAVMALDDREGPRFLALLLQTANDLVDELITRPTTTEALLSRLPQWVQDKLPAHSITGESEEAGRK